MELTKDLLELFYGRYASREYVHPDPLETLYAFGDAGDIEVAGFLAALTAYGRVEQILKSLNRIFSVSGPHPARWLREEDPAAFRESFRMFRHRFADGDHLAGLLTGMQGVLHHYGSLRAAFAREDRGRDTLEGLNGLVTAVLAHAAMDPGHLLPRPGKGSACKRLHLFLRWMVRKDVVDLGVWEDVGAERLLVPLDVHMHRIAFFFKMTDRKSGDIKTSREITRAFARFAPEDPVRYDFALTRIGILEKKKPGDFLASFAGV